MKKILVLLVFGVMSLFAAVDYHKTNNCLLCHGGIEHIRQPDTGMAKAIAKKADEAGYAQNSCIICHGGNPATKNKNKA